jgi:histidinol-phosphatase (PHP family)
MEVFNMKTNYHTHTYRCNHAKGLDEEYVLAAIKNGYDELGFADHSPWAYDSDFVSRIRMPMSAFKEYCDSVKALKEKYKDQINILSQTVGSLEKAIKDLQALHPQDEENI